MKLMRNCSDESIPGLPESWSTTPPLLRKMNRHSEAAEMQDRAKAIRAKHAQKNLGK